MTLDIFCSSLSNASLQRHLLAVEQPTPESTVREGNKFCQIQMPVEKARILIRQIEKLGQQEPAVAAMADPVNVRPQQLPCNI